MKSKNVAIILSGGQGVRFGKATPKAFIRIAGKEAIVHTLERFEQHKDIDEIIIVSKKDCIGICEELVKKYNFTKVSKIVVGGNTRQESSRIGLDAVADINPRNVLFHDAVRPFISERIISDIIKQLKLFPAIDVAIPSADTLIKINDKKIIQEIPKRAHIWRGQTPQGFHFSVIKKAHDKALKEGFKETTDDCGLVLKYKLGDVYVVNGEDENIKITYPIDIHIADKLFQIKNVDSKGVKSLLSLLSNKSILIFGHNSGIGKEIYEICKKEKAQVRGYSFPEVDIANNSDVKRTVKSFVKEFGGIDILISTAGILQISKLTEALQKDIVRQISVNYIGQINLVKEALPYMRAGGSIALFTSSSYTRGRGSYSIYSSTKAAIVNFVQAVSEEIAGDGIKINAICPARTNTPMRFNNFGKEPKNSLLNPKVVADATLRTCLSGLTGQIININKT